MDWAFTPDEDQQRLEVPLFEEARADFAPYYRSKATVADAQRQIITEIAKLGGGAVQFQSGQYGTRVGYRIFFYYGGQRGLLRVAGLPFKNPPTDIKREQARVQALLNVRDWLKSAVTAQVFSPGSEPLIPMLLVDGERTVADVIATDGRLPRINPSSAADPDVIEAEVVG